MRKYKFGLKPLYTFDAMERKKTQPHFVLVQSPK